jgi:hypothetical protein
MTVDRAWRAVMSSGGRANPEDTMPPTRGVPPPEAEGTDRSRPRADDFVARACANNQQVKARPSSTDTHRKLRAIEVAVSILYGPVIEVPSQLISLHVALRMLHSDNGLRLQSVAAPGTPIKPAIPPPERTGKKSPVDLRTGLVLAGGATP